MVWLDEPIYAFPNFIPLVSGAPDIPPPNPDYFDVHYRVARILEVRGSGEKVEHVWQPAIGSPRHLATDGSTDISSVLARKMLTEI